jgi:transcriptional regulator with XRE-family HTH domain
VEPGGLDPDQVVRDVGGKIREIRVARGFTQEQVADRLGMTVRAYQSVENGRNLTIRSLARIANVLGVPPADLFTAPAPYEPRRGRPPKAK